MKKIIILLTILFSCSTGIKIIEHDLDNPQRGNYEFKLQHFENEEGNINFILKVTRLNEDEDEYFPNSEKVRILVYNDNRDLVWSSNHNNYYLQATEKVLPKNVGETHEYSVLWDKSTNAGKPLAGGRYEVQVIFRTAPKNHIFQSFIKVK